MASIKRMLFTYPLFLFFLFTITTQCDTIQVAEGGSISDGLSISAIRTGTHPTYSRIVFDIVYWRGNKENAGKPSKDIGHYRFTLNEKNILNVELSGFRSTSIKSMVDIHDTRIKSIRLLTGEEYGDDSSIFYTIQLRNRAKLKVFHLYNPARIVLDIINHQ